MFCPECGASGRKVGKLTVDSHALPVGRLEADPADDWKFCRTLDCAVVYFSLPEVAPVPLGALRTTPFPKSDNPDRLVCFCFDHTVAAVAEDAQTHAESTLKAAITAACRSGLDDCARMNPEGVCCLGNVDAVIREATGAFYATWDSAGVLPVGYIIDTAGVVAWAEAGVVGEIEEIEGQVTALLEGR